jgi:hypothetical protein
MLIFQYHGIQTYKDSEMKSMMSTSGIAKESVREARDAIIGILNASAESAVKIAALNALTAVCSSPTSINNRSFVNQPRDSKTISASRDCPDYEGCDNHDEESIIDSTDSLDPQW